MRAEGEIMKTAILFVAIALVVDGAQTVFMI